jgi:Na+-transporting NADH:ubiquinone oxidoreductase subunit C
VASNDTVKKTITVALLLCIVCSVIVSTAAVLLRPAQVANKELDFKSNILAAAGLLEEGVSVEEQFKAVTTKVVDLRTGEFTDAVDPADYEQRKAAKHPTMSEKIAVGDDIAGIGRREHYAEVYFIDDGEGGNILVLPIKGYGLWSTLYGFIALAPDLNTVVGLGFYEHAETPGLGGEVDNPAWKAQWQGKKVYNEQGEVALSVIKGKVDEQAPNAEYRVDGLSGATLTSKGVDNLVQYWMSEEGYKPFLQNLKSGEA